MILAHSNNQSRKWTVTLLAIAAFIFVGCLALLPNTGSVAMAADPGDTIDIPNPPAVYGDVYGDLNKDGIYEWGKPEWGVRNVIVTLKYQGPSGTTLTTIADVNGYYWFENLTEFGAYTLSITLPDDFTATTPTSVEVEVSPYSVDKHQFGINGPQLFAFISMAYNSVSASSAASVDISGLE